jgi:hypothetical protein
MLQFQLVKVIDDYGSSVGVNLRRGLNEVVSGLEVHCWLHTSELVTLLLQLHLGADELAYNVNKQYSVAYGIVDPSGSAKNQHVVSLRYNY